MLALPACGHAQNGCLDSPESPTLVLLLVGGAGVCFKGFRRPRQ
jgi:XrtJ-associated TM-motif-TM protein